MIKIDCQFEFLAAYTLLFIYMKCLLGAYKNNLDIHISEAIVASLRGKIK